jgi:hypothetical protein
MEYHMLIKRQEIIVGRGHKVNYDVMLCYKPKIYRINQMDLKQLILYILGL